MPKLFTYRLVKGYLNKSNMPQEERDTIIKYVDWLVDRLDAKILEIARMHKVKRRMREKQFQQQLSAKSRKIVS